MTPDDPRRRIPAVERLLNADAFAPLLAGAPRPRVTAAIQAVQAELRASLDDGAATPAWLEDAAAYAERAAAWLVGADTLSLQRVINATGVVLHTNLGRAPLAPAAIAAVGAVAAGYTNLEYDLAAGRRGSRYAHCAALLAEVAGAEDALVVNNNAAALLLSLNELAEGRDVVLSRGELVEIGGGFRIHEIAAKSGARLREVGSTNRTHARDYEDAIGPGTGALLKVHRSNFRVTGFVAEVTAAELARIAAERGLPLIHDLGSGLLIDGALAGIDEPTAAQAIAAGASLVTMSGDKLLGGPQAGIVVGRRELVARLRENPLARALRVDRMTLAALEATLQLFRDPERAWVDVPALRALRATPAELLARAERWAGALRDAGFAADAVLSAAPAGGGAAPDVELAGAVVALSHASLSTNELEGRLRAGKPPVVARIANGRLLLDPRTVAADEEAVLLDAVKRAAG